MKGGIPMGTLNFHVVRGSHDVVVVRTNGKYEQHAHVANKKVAHKLIKMLEMGFMPTTEYLVGSAKRLLTDEEFSKLVVKDKDFYKNSNIFKKRRRF